ncbi:MAG: FUSC family protein, partial [Thermoactinospora sp.]|nr:FUSC family protein [Thermoactinospora sp.]
MARRDRWRIAPGWLVEVVRPAPATPDWPRMIRTSVSTTAPILVALLAGDLAAGVVPSMGALNAAMSDQSGPYRVRLLRMGAAALAGATGFLLGRLSAGHGWWAVLVLMAVSVVAALVSTAGDIGSVIGLQLLVVAVLGA